MQAQEYSSTYNEQNLINATQEPPCPAEISPSHASNHISLQQPVDTAQQTMMSPSDGYQQAVVHPNNNFPPCSLSFNQQAATDQCLSVGPSNLPCKMSAGTLQHHQGHGYHGNGDIGSSVAMKPRVITARVLTLRRIASPAYSQVLATSQPALPYRDRKWTDSFNLLKSSHRCVTVTAGQLRPRFLLLTTIPPDCTLLLEITQVISTVAALVKNH